MLAARLPSILPPLSPSELLEVSMIASVAGEIRDGALTAKRPFRSPHHSASMAALTGGGIRAKPGEISLAHQGVLFLDELPEFDPRVLDSLRQPLENGEVAVSRANHRVTYPARFMLVAAMNPCRCGHAYEAGFSCKRGRIDRCTSDYQARISGPLMDRIDLRIDDGDRNEFGKRRQVVWAEPELPSFIKINPTAVPTDTLQPGDITMGMMTREFLETPDEYPE